MSESKKRKNNQPEKKNKKLKKLFLKTIWRLSGLLIWLWFFDSISYKLQGYECLNIPNKFLYLLFIVPLFYILSKEPLKIVLYVFYLFTFPFVAIYILIKIIIIIYKFINKLLLYITRGIDLFTCITGAICFFTIFVILQISIIKIDEINLQLPFAILNLVVLLLLILSITRWVHDPYRPVKNFQETVLKIGKSAAKKYHENSVKIAIESKDKKRITRELNLLNSIEKGLFKLKEKFDFQFKFSLKKRITSYSTAVFFIFILIVLFGYAGSILSLTRLTATAEYPTLLKIQNKQELFEGLPGTSTYLDCVYQSFSIMTISQDFTLSNTSPVGKIIIILEILTTIFIFTQLLTVFSTIIGLDEEFKLISMDEIIDKITNRINVWRNDLNTTQVKKLQNGDNKEIKIP
ncbi:hypothetical protein JW824_13830 [bacterium]|nr:hypothetical protein [bacterium]